jgi:hypothetical protein
MQQQQPLVHRRSAKPYTAIQSNPIQCNLSNLIYLYIYILWTDWSLFRMRQCVGS